MSEPAFDPELIGSVPRRTWRSRLLAVMGLLPRGDSAPVVIRVELSEAQAQALAELVCPGYAPRARQAIYNEAWLEAMEQARAKLATELQHAGYEGWTWPVPESED